MKKNLLKSLLSLVLACTLVFGTFVTALAAEPEPVDESGFVAEPVDGDVTEEAPEEEAAEEDVIDVDTPDAEPAPDAPVVSEEEEPTTEEPITEEPIEEEPTTEEPIEEEPVAQEEEPVVEEEPEAAAQEEPEAVPQDAIVTYKTLAQVTGITYDKASNRIYWNAVPNATRYYYTLTDTKTGVVGPEFYTSGLFIDTQYVPDGSYTISVHAMARDVYYLFQANVTWDKYQTDWIDGDNYNYANDKRGEDALYNHYRRPVGPDATYSFTLSTPAQDPTTITTLPGIRIKEMTDNGAGTGDGNVVFELAGTVTLKDDEYIVWEYSNNAQFDDKEDGNYKDYEDGETLTLSHYVYGQGQTIYVRARVYNDYYDPDKGEEVGYGPYTNVVTYAIPAFTMGGITTTVTADSITLRPNVNHAVATGYQYARKAGSKWVSLGTSNGNVHTDAGLAKDKKYTYRVRAYLYNDETKQTIWTGWKTVSATTWGASMNLKADVASKTSVKLSWNKLSDAEYYEIYRRDTSSSGINHKEDLWQDSFSSYTLIKTINKASTKSYTDKKLTSGNSYSYYLRAYRTVNGQKMYIQQDVDVTLAAGSMKMAIKQDYYTSKGTCKVVWTKMTGLKGYKVEELDQATNTYKPYKNLKASATTITFPRVPAGQPYAKYRIQPYSASRVYSSYETAVYPQLGVVQNVKATATTDGISVSWKAVPGADYYRVYRTTSNYTQYNATTKSYGYSGGTTVYDAYVDGTNRDASLYDYEEYNSVGSYKTAQITGISVVDREVTYKVRAEDDEGKYIEDGTRTVDGQVLPVYKTEDKVWNEGPELGVTYYYYVVAHARVLNGQAGQTSISSIGNSKAASAVFTEMVAPKMSKAPTVKASSGKVTVSYKKAKGAAGYAIYRASSKNGTYQLVGTTTASSFKDSNVVKGKKYYYKVASYVKGESQSFVYSKMTKASKAITAK